MTMTWPTIDFQALDHAGIDTDRVRRTPDGLRYDLGADGWVIFGPDDFGKDDARPDDDQWAATLYNDDGDDTITVYGTRTEVLRHVTRWGA